MNSADVEPAQPLRRLDQRTLLRATAFAFLIGWGLHGLDHLRRGMSASPEAVMYGGTLQAVVVIIAIVMALRDRPRAPDLAAFIGIVSAILVTYGHLLPSFWPTLQDSFSTGPRINVTWFSWLTAILEILTGLAFAYAGVRARDAAPTADV